MNEEAKAYALVVSLWTGKKGIDLPITAVYNQDVCMWCCYYSSHIIDRLYSKKTFLREALRDIAIKVCKLADFVDGATGSLEGLEPKKHYYKAWVALRKKNGFDSNPPKMSQRERFGEHFWFIFEDLEKRITDFATYLLIKAYGNKYYFPIILSCKGAGMWACLCELKAAKIETEVYQLPRMATLAMIKELVMLVEKHADDLEGLALAPTMQHKQAWEFLRKELNLGMTPGRWSEQISYKPDIVYSVELIPLY